MREIPWLGVCGVVSLFSFFKGDCVEGGGVEVYSREGEGDKDAEFNEENVEIVALIFWFGEGGGIGEDERGAVGGAWVVIWAVGSVEGAFKVELHEIKDDDTEDGGGVDERACDWVGIGDEGAGDVGVSTRDGDCGGDNRLSCDCLLGDWCCWTGIGEDGAGLILFLSSLLLWTPLGERDGSSLLTGVLERVGIREGVGDDAIIVGVVIIVVVGSLSIGVGSWITSESERSDGGGSLAATMKIPAQYVYYRGKY